MRVSSLSNPSSVGMHPRSWLLLKLSDESLLALPSSVGMLPDKKLPDKSRSWMLACITPRCGGMLPSRLFPCKCKMKSSKPRSSLGNLPLSFMDCNSSTSSMQRLLMSFKKVLTESTFLSKSCVRLLGKRIERFNTALLTSSLVKLGKSAMSKYPRVTSKTSNSSLARADMSAKFLCSSCPSMHSAVAL